MEMTTNRVIAIVLAVCAILYLYFAFQIPDFPIRRPIDSDVFPKVLGGLLLFLSVLLFFDRSASGSAGEEAESAPSTAAGAFGWVLVVLTALAVALYAWALPRAGFLLSSVLLTLGLSWLYGFRRHAIIVVVSVSIPLILYFVLTRFMGIFLPPGIIPI